MILSCLLVAFAVLILGATGHVRAVRTSLRQSEERLLKSSLKTKSEWLLRNLRRLLSEAPVTATYDLSGRLLRPAPPRWGTTRSLPCTGTGSSS